MPVNGNALRSVTLTVLLSAAIFVLNLVTPWGRVVGVLYLIPLLLVSPLLQPQGLIVVVATYTALMILALLGAPAGGVSLEMAAFNCGAGLLALWVATLLLAHRKRAEDAMRDQARSLEEAQRVAHVGSWDQSLETGALTWSEELRRIYGVDPKLPIPSFEDLAQFYTPESWARLRTTVEKALQTGAPFELDLQIVRTDGTVIWVATHGEVVRDATGRIVGTHGTVLDIAERKHLEEAAQRRERRFRALIERSQDLVSINDPDGTYLYVNPAHEAVYGFKPGEVVGRNAFDFLHPDDAQKLVPVLAEAIRTGVREATVEYRLRHKDGSCYAFEGIALNLLDDPDVAGILITGRDITERKRAEAEEAALLDIAKDITGLVDLNEILKRVHQRVATVLPCDRITTYYWDAARSTYRALAWHGVPLRLDSDTITLEFHSSQPVAERLLAGETVLINDIANQCLVPLEILNHFGLTAALVVPLVVHGRRMGALAALNAEGGRRFDAHQVRLFEGIAQHVGGVLEVADLYRAQEEETAIAGALARVGQEIISSLSSPALLDRLCQLTTEVLGCDRSRIWLWHAPDEAFVPVAGYGDSPEQREIMRLVKFGRSALATQLAGMERDGVFNTKVADLPDSEAKAEARAYGVTASLMVSLRRGGELVGFHTADYRGREEVLGERHQRIARGIGQLASLALETVRLIEELERANRLKSDFVATMSHELRTPLNIIMGYNDLLLEEAFGPLGADQVETLRRTQKSAGELLALINSTLDIGRLDTGKLPVDVQEIDLGELHREIAAETTSLREKPAVTVVWDVPPELPRLHTDRAKLKVVVKNLLANAVKFSDEGQVTVRARACDGGVEIAVTDTGIGIAPDVLPIIFDPFRQGDSGAARHYGGVGLGLYIARRYLDLLGGTISVESAVGRGSTFLVRLPPTRNVPALHLPAKR